MAPWAGRVRNGRFTFDGRTWELPRTAPPHAIHGTVYDTRWAWDGPTRLRADLGPDWPFPGHAIQAFDLQDTRLVCRLELHAHTGRFPASLGWHPWFRRRLAGGESVSLGFEPTGRYARDAEGIPTGSVVPPGTGPFDDCFSGLRAPPTLRWGEALRVTLHSAATHWVLFDELDHAVCVEPQTGPPDALNIAPRYVEPGRPLTLDLELRWALPSPASAR